MAFPRRYVRLPRQAAAGDSYTTQDDFRVLLANFPALLSGNQIDAGTPRRWLMITREKSIPSEQGERINGR
jgi:hypothetical protein